MVRDRLLVVAATAALALALLGAIAGSLPTLGGGLGAGLALLALRRWGPPRLRGVAVYLLFLALACEAGLQLAAVAGLLPGVDVCEHAPYGRLYWTREGFANETMNRRGWHAAPFRLRDGERRIALIGDSFVQSVQVLARETMAALLEQHLEGTEVLALGRSGVGPAHHREMLRHAREHYAPDEAVLVLFLGNDFSDLAPALRGRAPERYLYVERDAAGGVRPLPASEPALGRFREDLERNERALVFSLPWTLKSHVLAPTVLRAVGRVLRGPDEPLPASDLAGDLAHEGIHAGFFRDPPGEDDAQVLALAEAILDACVADAAQAGVTLRVVTIPYFPARFYAQGPETGWTRVVDGYDFAAPERRLAAWADARGVPFLALGDAMERDGLTREQVRALYYREGTGHFTPAGHRYAADAMAGAFRGGR